MIDYILVILLVGVIPAGALYKSFWDAHRTTNRSKRYLKSGAMIAGLLALLYFDWWHASRTLTSLGLDIPLSERGLIGLAIIPVLVLVAAAVGIIQRRRGDGSDDQKTKRKPSDNYLFPRNRHELSLFLVLAFLIGSGWELLYRGFLIWFFVPHVGTVIAVCIASLAYGTAHGYQTRGKFIASIISAFVFTVAFVLTASLWWLMLIHTALVVVGGLASYKRASGSDEAPPLSVAGVRSQ